MAENATVPRRLAAILAADVAGYSRLIGADEEGTLARLRAIRAELIDPKLDAHRGRLVKTTGDGLLVEFGSVVDALRCAAEVQRAMANLNSGTPPEDRIEFRIGIHQGDIVVEDGDIFGDGVNIAARLEGAADPGGICVSARVQEDAAGKLDLAFEDLGEQQLKNIARPVHVYRVRPQAMTAAAASSARLTAVPASVAPRLSIVVLPFANLSNDPEEEYFADGITDDLTTDLSRIADSFVIARNTAFTYKGTAVDAKRVARELGVRYVLEGSVRRSGDRVRVNVQLIDGDSGAHLWADRFDTDRASLVETQDAITGRLARTLNLELVRDIDRRIEQEKTGNPDGRDLTMRGWASYYRTRSLQNLQEAQRIFEQALTVDPGSVDAKIGLATALLTIYADGSHSSQDLAHAEQLLREALERDANRAALHHAMGMLRRFQNRLAESQIEFEAAIALDRNHVHAWSLLGSTLMFRGQPDAALFYVEHALRLNPRDPVMHVYLYTLGACHLLLGHIDQALDLLRRARAVNSRLWFIHLWLAGALGLKGEVNEASAALAEMIRLRPETSSRARLLTFSPWTTNSEYLALADTTLFAGLRRAGLPDE